MHRFNSSGCSAPTQHAHVRTCNCTCTTYWRQVFVVSARSNCCRVDQTSDSITATCVVDQSGFVIRSPCSPRCPERNSASSLTSRSAGNQHQAGIDSQRRHRISSWKDAGHTIETDAREVLSQRCTNEDRY
ncbi:hypothetical protein F441_14186 [Phytophthora nicotianae CJ01A1]|uniref:Uncharacterized protein n=2 Tax=Phytophthora nicotianae TaxID=4792 RepID=W2WIB2_PHYNI|nr:hypothetical protein F444_14308 [Phytophthora nicotianae P1976]ETP10102.1 hypothetical protein F441_14186 [Phytophthora nicotianae CJ01A1]